MRTINQLKIRVKNQKSQQISAFTLLEALVVLLISCTIIVLFETTFQRTVHIIRGELFVLEFENTLKQQQSQAITRAEVRTLTSENNVVKLNGKRLHIPDETIFSDFDITFKATGNIKSIKRARVIITLPYQADKQITYQLQLGSGQYKKTTS